MSPRAEDDDEGQRAWFKRTIKQRLERWYHHYVLELLLRQLPLPPSKDGRHVPLLPAHDKPLIDERRGHAYISNHVRSSRYTIWDFLPKQIFFQATRLHNFYFICIGIPQAIPGLSTTGSYTTILPVLFFMVLTVLKEAYDDYRRHRLDKVENTSCAVVLRRKKHSEHGQVVTKLLSVPTELKTFSWPTKTPKGKTVDRDTEADEDDEFQWTEVQWHSIRVGDILKLKRDDPVPADIVLLHASGENGQAYVETMALDGETNLKSRIAPRSLRACSKIQGIKSCDALFVLEDPNPDLYDFNGSLTHTDGKKLPLTLNEVVYRGSVIRNTTSAVGIVINSGEENKIRMNANQHPTAKKPRLEHFANQIVLTLIVYVVLLSAGLSVGYRLWHRSTEVRSWYLNNAYVGFQQIIIGFLIMFNNVIPLALYVSMEIVKIGQMIMLHSDVKLYDEDSNTPMICNTNTILENLGQVSYILTDKTGTLTRNVMNFRGMSVAGVVCMHGEDASPVAVQPVSARPSYAAKEGQSIASTEAHDVSKGKSGVYVEEKEIPVTPSSSRLLQPRSSITTEPLTHKHRAVSYHTTAELIRYIQRVPQSPFAQKAHLFILGMALCHVCLPETNKETGSVEFQASSPDELALVRAAQELGYTMIQRNSNVIKLDVTNASGKQEQQVYEILDVIDFSSKRKRMSIILRCPDGRIWLVCKGADSVVVPLLQQSMLAEEKAGEVRRSVEVERRSQRRSQQHERLSGLGERSSMAIQRSLDVRRTTLEVPRVSHSTNRYRPSFESSRGNVDSLASFDEPIDEATTFSRSFKHLDDFATEGLRTLLFAHKTISTVEYVAWKQQFQSATTSLTQRQARIEAAGELIEHSLDLLGASAIEDKLQAGVPETITKLRRANIKVWMLTGDKRETAINIAHSAQICRPGSEILVLDSSKGDLSDQLRAIKVNLQNVGSEHSVAVIDGNTLGEVESDPALKHLFYNLVPLIDSVLCCRASPAQKASIVKAIRTRVPGALTLAIGDGANDISMIQASHVGIGISGKEGLQAARVADYSIAQFRFLQRLLLVHGRWNYMRTAKFILMTFWKEFFFYMMQALYLQHNGYTGTSLYESSSLTVLNTLFTSLCVIMMGVFEQDLRADTLLAVPELYTYGQKNLGLNLPDYLLWVLGATAEGMIVWFVSWAAYGVFDSTGDNGLFAFGDLVFTLGIIWTNWKLFILETHYKTVIVAVSFSITFAGWWAWNAFLSAIYTSNLSPYDVRYGFTQTFGKDPVWWLTIVLAFSLLAALELGYKTARHSLIRSGKWRALWKFSSKDTGAESDAEDLGIWQEMEQDPVIWERLKALAAVDATKIDEGLE